MLSIIISSYQPEYYDNLLKNINETIGDDFKYEVIQIWNPDLMGITEAYNKGAEKARFDYLLFTHEDILFHTRNWGHELLKHLEDPNIGIVGIAGSSYVPCAPSGWYISDSKYNSIYCIQNNNKKDRPNVIDTFHKKEGKKRVFALDGVFLATKKQTYKEVRFNEKIKGFHGYDLDFSLRMAENYENYVINNILIEHFSDGNPDQKWFDNLIQVKKNIKVDFNKEKNSEIEKKVFLEFLGKYFSYHYISRKTLLDTLKFFPKKITFNTKLQIFKAYFYYVRFSKSYNKKFRNA